MYGLDGRHAYTRWVAAYDVLSASDRTAIRECVAGMPGGILFSLMLTATEAGSTGPGDHPQRALASLQAQLFPHWEVLATAAALSGEVDRRHVALPAGDGDPLRLYNEALARARGRYVVLLPPGAVLAEHALFVLAHALLAEPELELVFTDEDRLDRAGERHSPRFKTAWDPDRMLGCDAVGHLAALRTETVRALGGMRPAPGKRRPAAEAELAHYDLVLRLGEAVPPSRIGHLPAVLCHRLDAADPGWDAAAARDIVRRHLEETGVAGATVEPAPLSPACSRVLRPLPRPAPAVSVIVPTRDAATLLARCAEGVLARTDYAPLELLLVDNDSRDPEALALLARLAEDPRVRVLPFSGPFNFAAMNNAAVREARGEVVVLLNNDTEVIEPDWLTELVALAARPEIGAVGAKLLYADGRVQHCGITLGPDWSLIHQLRLSGRFDAGPNRELAVTRSVSAVTAACLACRRAVYLEAGGLDEENLKVAFNDVDFCLRLGDRGYRILVTPFAELLHLESVSRGYDLTPAKQAENARETRNFRRIWDPVLDTDPYHNANLVFRWEDTVLATPPRWPRPWHAPWRDTMAGRPPALSGRAAVRPPGV
ncbi:glycosyltransferase family 2 protein [Roseomonas sp. NAR14]|uniref:Glycosyltransferase family 2 protein n=1 Tax=Roseomonas acroporae TaxID=2937791 RepID=A0A9X2BUB0_9PROT|nr:glycosyltransferase family 2 protein [Roseomonas acroporae]MCK8783866.1 glycosyltransferase family 2 protein [Roseomonas acroporae]